MKHAKRFCVELHENYFAEASLEFEIKRYLPLKQSIEEFNTYYKEVDSKEDFDAFYESCPFKGMFYVCIENERFGTRESLNDYKRECIYYKDTAFKYPDYIFFSREDHAKQFIKELCKFLNENYCADLNDLLMLKEKVEKGQ